MNKIRRMAISKVISQVEACQSLIDDILEEEQDYLDNIPENLGASERYEKADNAVSYLESAADDLASAVEYLEAAMA